MKRLTILFLFTSLVFPLFTGNLSAQDQEPQTEKTREQIEKDKKMEEARKKRAEQRKKKKTLGQKMEEFMKQMGAATKAGNYGEMEKICTAALKEFPESPLWYYNLACAQARQSKKEEAFTSLEKAIDLGFRDTDHIEKDEDLVELREDPQFKVLIDKAKELRSKVTVSDVKNGIALVTQGNLAVDNKLKIFRAFFKLPPEPDAELPPITGRKDDPIVSLIKTWYKEGTAAGNQGDFYDNRDGDHSNLRFRNFPQLTRIEYSNDLKARGIDKAMSAWIYFNGNVIGNASMAGHRSLPRTAQISPLIGRQYLQYITNHIYVYPEHRDHDPLVNDKGKGNGDTFPANTPYCLISQGSSGSDRPFMEAVTETFASFHPEVKAFLSENGILIPTVQMIFRSTMNAVEKPEDYLDGRAHPTVFRKEDINAEKMIRMAHDMKKEYAPPLVQLNVVEEDQPVQGIDFFSRLPNQVLFNTPCAIARIKRAKDYMFRIVVSAANSKDPNSLDLTCRWVVLRGDADRISINLQDEKGTSAELLIPWHTRKPVPSRPEIESNRVDIGVFVHNGTYWSAPGFVTVFFQDHEIREYDKDNRILSIDYNTAKNKYVDAIVSAKKNWKDVYQYAEDGTLLGWKRFRGELSQDFSAEGGLVLSRDEKGRPLSAKKVKYKFDIDKGQTRSTLKQEDTDDVLWYWYENDTALKGEVVTKEEYDKRNAK